MKYPKISQWRRRRTRRNLDLGPSQREALLDMADQPPWHYTNAGLADYHGRERDVVGITMRRLIKRGLVEGRRDSAWPWCPVAYRLTAVGRRLVVDLRADAR